MLLRVTAKGGGATYRYFSRDVYFGIRWHLDRVLLKSEPAILFFSPFRHFSSSFFLSFRISHQKLEARPRCNNVEERWRGASRLFEADFTQLSVFRESRCNRPPWRVTWPRTISCSCICYSFVWIFRFRSRVFVFYMSFYIFIYLFLSLLGNYNLFLFRFILYFFVHAFPFPPFPINLAL